MCQGRSKRDYKVTPFLTLCASQLGERISRGIQRIEGLDISFSSSHCFIDHKLIIQDSLTL